MTSSFRIPCFLFLLLAGIAPAYSASDLRLATTTSTENSGLLNTILPLFEAKYGNKVRVISVGSGKAMKLGENGDVDVVLVHSRADEEKFVAAGFGVNRRDVMYIDFIIVGPKSDPAGIREMEQSYWKAAGVEPAAMPGYVSAGLGMGEVLMMAAEMRGYTLTDRATCAAYRAKTGLEILVSGDTRLFNPYGVIAVNPARHPGVNYPGAMQFIEWLTSSEGQAAIAAFRVDGEQLFFPNAR